MHTTSHPQAGQTVTVQFQGGHPQIPGSKTETVQYRIEDWWDLLTGESWGSSAGNPACIIYGMRGGLNGLPWDDEVVYGKAVSEDGFEFGHLVHVSEIVPS